MHRPLALTPALSQREREILRTCEGVGGGLENPTGGDLFPLGTFLG